MRVIAHRKSEVCLRCHERTYCLDCNICASCSFVFEMTAEQVEEQRQIAEDWSAVDGDGLD